MSSANGHDKDTSTKYLPSIKIDAELHEKLMEQYETQRQDKGGIEFKGDYFGMLFTESLRAHVNQHIGEEVATKPEMDIEGILATLDQRNRQRRQLWAVSIIMFILFFIAALFAWKFYKKSKEELA